MPHDKEQHERTSQSEEEAALLKQPNLAPFCRRVQCLSERGREALAILCPLWSAFSNPMTGLEARCLQSGPTPAHIADWPCRGLVPEYLDTCFATIRLSQYRLRRDCANLEMQGGKTHDSATPIPWRL